MSKYENGSDEPHIQLICLVSIAVQLIKSLSVFNNASGVASNVILPALQQGHDPISIFNELKKHGIFIIACPTSYFGDQMRDLNAIHPINKKQTSFVYWVCMNGETEYTHTLNQMGLSETKNESILSNSNLLGFLTSD